MKSFFKVLALVALVSLPVSVYAAEADIVDKAIAAVAETEAAKDVAAKGDAKSEAVKAKPIIDKKDKAADAKKEGAKKDAPKAVAAKKEDTKVATGKVAAPEAPVSATPAAMTSPARGVNYVGEIKSYKAHAEDTLLTIGDQFDLGYVELRSANPSMDPWHPGAGTFVIIPSMHLYPDAPRKGIVVNLSEMRMYYFAKDGSVKTHPIGVGREGFSTPMGTTTVTHKVIGPVWTPTERMRKEDPTLPARKGPGEDNPLGTHALYLGWPQYLLHGTNKPWGIGRRVSSGCVRMYNKDAEDLYNTVPVGTMVTVVRQAIKFGWVGDMLYVEAHPDDVLADQVERAGYARDYKVPDDLFDNIGHAAGDARERIDWQAVREALKQRRGYPVPILKDPKDEEVFVSVSMETRAGTSRFGPRLTKDVVTPVKAAGTPKAEEVDVDSTQAVRKRKTGFN